MEPPSAKPQAPKAASRVSTKSQIEKPSQAVGSVTKQTVGSSFAVKQDTLERKSLSVFKDRMNSVIDPDYETQLKEELVNQHPKREMARKVFTSPFFFGAIAFLVVVATLYAVKPPFVLKKPTNENSVEERKIDHLVVWGTAFGCFVLVAGIPFIPVVIKKISAAQIKTA